MGGWSFAPWRGTFYPPGLVQHRELEYASRVLGAIEVNSTFYRAQSPATYAKWATQVPDGFVFSLKAPRRITQGGPLADKAAAAAAFVNGGLAELGARLGPVLWQLPPSRGFDRDDLDRFLGALPRSLAGQPLRHALEARHPGFLDPDYVELARSHGVATVYTDSAQHPNLADITGGFVYARLMRAHEEVASGYPEDELQAWSDTARTWAMGGDPPGLPHVLPPLARQEPREVFLYFISAAKVRNPAAAQGLISRLDGPGA